MEGKNLYQSLWEKFLILKIWDGNSFHFQGEIFTPGPGKIVYVEGYITLM